MDTTGRFFAPGGNRLLESCGAVARRDFRFQAVKQMDRTVPLIAIEDTVHDGLKKTLVYYFWVYSNLTFHYTKRMEYSIHWLYSFTTFNSKRGLRFLHNKYIPQISLDIVT